MTGKTTLSEAPGRAQSKRPYPWVPPRAGRAHLRAARAAAVEELRSPYGLPPLPTARFPRATTPSSSSINLVPPARIIVVHRQE